MTDDIVKRLTRATEGKFDGMLLDLLPEAADEIERLRTANRNLLHTIERLGDQMLEGEARHD